MRGSLVPSPRRRHAKHPTVGQRKFFVFGVRALPTGLKTFTVHYRNSEGIKRRINLGRYGVITVDQARDLAKIKLGEMDESRISEWLEWGEEVVVAG